MRNIGWCLAVALLLSCAEKKKAGQEESLTAEEFFADTGYEGSCPYLSPAGDGTVVLSWIRRLPGKEAAVCYSVSGNKAGFGDPVVVPGSDGVKAHGENPPRVVIAPDGRILAAWGVANPGPKNPYSGLVYYSVSTDEGKSWTEPRRISTDPESIDQRYFDLEILADGNIGAVWLDNRSGTALEGSGLYFAALGADHSFEGEKRIDNTTCQCCRTDLFAGADGDLHIAYRKIIDGAVRDMVHVVSHDNGNLFSAPQRISADNWKINGCPHTGPAIARNRNGLFFVWYTMGGGNGVFHASSADNGDTFSKKEYVSDNPSARHPQINVLPDGQLVTVWDEKAGERSRIGFEIRTEKGQKPGPEANGYLTDKSSDASYPVVIPVNGGVLVAYSVQKKSGEERVAFRVLDQKFYPGSTN